MKTKNILYTILITSVIVGCSGPKKQVLGSKEEVEAEIPSIKLNYETVLVMDTVIPKNPGIKDKEVRKINPSNPPVKLNLVAKPEEKELKLSDFYSKVKYIKLKHPLTDQGKAFLGNVNLSIKYEQGSSSGRGYNSSVFLTSKNIIAGDNYFGYHCYDQDGNFIYTIAVMSELPVYRKITNEVTVSVKPELRMINAFSIQDDNCLIYTSQNNKSQLNFHNITEKKTYLSRPYYSGGSPYLVNKETYISYLYNVRAASRMPFMLSFDIKGDTLSSFMNYNSLVEPKNAQATNPDAGNIYYFNNTLTLRQAYNDTIYRFTSPNELTAAYILNSSSQKLDLNTALYGDKTDKIIPNRWLETDKFAFIVHTQNNDTPNNRGNNTVKFFYSFYDKKESKFFRIPTDVYPDDFLITNDIKDGIPLSISQAKENGGRLYSGYSKAQLEDLTKHKNFSSLPSGQQAKVKSLLSELADGEMLLMILE